MNGVCIIITNPHGTVMSSAVDFAGADAAGFSPRQEQKRRAQHRALMSFTKTHLNDWLAGKVDEHFARHFWELADRAGYKMQVIDVSTEDASP